MSTFQIGEKIVCVDDFYDGRCREFGICPLDKGSVYVVRSIAYPTRKEGVRLIGIQNSGDNSGEFCYLVKGFRRLSEMKREHSISMSAKDLLWPDGIESSSLVPGLKPSQAPNLPEGGGSQTRRLVQRIRGCIERVSAAKRDGQPRRRASIESGPSGQFPQVVGLCVEMSMWKMSTSTCPWPLPGGQFHAALSASPELPPCSRAGNRRVIAYAIKARESTSDDKRPISGTLAAAWKLL